MERGDLIPRGLDDLSWEDDHLATSVGRVVAHAIGEAESVVSWYWRARRWKRRLARAFRLGAVLATAATGILPIVAQLYMRDGRPPFEPAWASVPLAAAALLVALDRFYGWSTSWMRFVAAGLRVRQLLQELQLDWEAHRTTWEGGAPTRAQAQEVIDRCRRFLGEVNLLVREEANLWIAEFRGSLRQLDEQARQSGASLSAGDTRG